MMQHKSFLSSRINALSDGVFAIAMTLLVFNIQIPDLVDIKPGEDFQTKMQQQIPHIFSWLLSVAILCRLWLNHNHLMADHESKSVGFTSLNFLLLGAVAFIPFPSALLGEYPDQAWSVILLSISYAVAALAIAGMWFIAPNRASVSGKRVLLVSMVMLLTSILACLLTIFNPYWGLALWITYVVGIAPLAYLMERYVFVEAD
ncbi:TMEM175 family protein [Microbulbifer sp. MLAF003]|uniref:TMEM175 family protein n=1 Tax=Microbulbifer TaxID=48073 RepID=UPI000A04ED1A|nr:MULTISPECIES: TMEM175 family protein [Microbulbifer]WHI49356.1 TMEM175 family protein [Microbulbifer sp. MLAF003]